MEKTDNVIKWFNKINNKSSYTFIKFNKEESYPSISKNLLLKNIYRICKEIYENNKLRRRYYTTLMQDSSQTCQWSLDQRECKARPTWRSDRRLPRRWSLPINRFVPISIFSCIYELKKMMHYLKMFVVSCSCRMSRILRRKKLKGFNSRNWNKKSKMLI